MQKKAISPVITTTLFIGIGVITAGIVWMVVVNIATGSVNSEAGEGLVIDLDIKSAYLTPDLKIIVNLERLSGKGNLTKIKFLINTENSQEVIVINETLKELEQREFTLTPITINASEAKEISVIPILNENEGGIKDTANVRKDGCFCVKPENTCIGVKFNDNCDNKDVCTGTKTPDCGTRVCGMAPNNCGYCGSLPNGECALGTICADGICQIGTLKSQLLSPTLNYNIRCLEGNNIILYTRNVFTTSTIVYAGRAGTTPNEYSHILKFDISSIPNNFIENATILLPVYMVIDNSVLNGQDSNIPLMLAELQNSPKSTDLEQNDLWPQTTSKTTFATVKIPVGTNGQFHPNQTLDATAIVKNWKTTGISTGFMITNGSVLPYSKQTGYLTTLVNGLQRQRIFLNVSYYEL